MENIGPEIARDNGPDRKIMMMMIGTIEMSMTTVTDGWRDLVQLRWELKAFPFSC